MLPVPHVLRKAPDRIQDLDICVEPPLQCSEGRFNGFPKLLAAYALCRFLRVPHRRCGQPKSQADHKRDDETKAPDPFLCVIAVRS